MLLNSQKVKMVEPFISNLNTTVTASEIARKQGLNQKSTQLFTEELEQEGILTSATQGRNKLYSLNKDNKEQLIQFLCTIEHLRTMQFYKQQPEIKLLIQKILPYTKGIVAIFGSYVKQTQKEDSDIDVFIIGNYDEKKLAEITTTYNIEINIKKQQTFKQDVLTKEIQKHHIIMKNTEEYIREVLTWTN